jgi:hypothetical protein
VVNNWVRITRGELVPATVALSIVPKARLASEGGVAPSAILLMLVKVRE